ncbi:MAG: helix-hairpin-helix domain-containing protein [Selenomonadaceae bacterium]|nr:helix-hairpin-helix domain-containing protein [Selenomonadaceae bacterium]MBR1859817.1 helix-hairpin-helix domain-containing protein [Selenomonadaceae bacterium]
MPMFRNSMMILLVIAAAALIGAGYGYSTSDDIKKSDTGTLQESTSDTSKDSIIYVYVTGAVNKPGMVELSVDDNKLRVVDAINACGGLLPTADSEAINMAEEISDGQHIRVPEKIIEQIAENSSEQSVKSMNTNSNKNKKSSDSGNIVNINTADADELDTLPGIGPAMAQRIIDYRQTHGSFKSIDEIQNVRGIGQKKFENLKSRITI